MAARTLTTVRTFSSPESIVSSSSVSRLTFFLVFLSEYVICVVGVLAALFIVLSSSSVILLVGELGTIAFEEILT